ncbi:MAG: hypothetical protein IJ029_00305 [Lachnospiraceae bacterium]|nr:hypothetical protein [Lachnospiraceae bacterium]
MGKQTVTIRRVGSVSFGIVLLLSGFLLLAHTFFPKFDYLTVYRFWPVTLIMLGIEVLVGSRGKNVEVLDEQGKVIEQSKTVYDFAAIIMTAVVLGAAIFTAAVCRLYEI